MFNLCDNRRVLGVSCADYCQQGALAEYVAVPQHVLYRLPDDLSFERAALVEPLSIAVHAIGRVCIRLEDTALVVGCGTIGLLVIQALRLTGCRRIVATDVDEDKLRLARQLGADVALNAADAESTQQIIALTEGRGADIAFEAVGVTATVNTVILNVRKGGHVVLIGNVTALVELPLQSAVTREITLHGSCQSLGEYPDCLSLISRGAVNVDPLISAIVPLQDGPSWFERLGRQEKGLLKVILIP
jgi:L-iditol 2-dehydrogenase